MGSLVNSVWDSLVGHTSEEPEILDHANQFMDWASKPQHQRFLDWLYDEADKPVPIDGTQINLIIGTARANTFKEIRRYLYAQESSARTALDREQHG